MENMVHREPDFENIARVLRCEKPYRPTLFEFFMNDEVYRAAAGPSPAGNDAVERLKYIVNAFAACGYDYANTSACDLSFPSKRVGGKNTISLNDSVMIQDWDDFRAYPWPDPDAQDYSRLEKIKPFLPPKMKLMTAGPGGLLENVIMLTGYENLCLMLYDEPELVDAIFDRVGSILLRYYEHCVQYDTVGILMINDDWGFNSQTMLSLKDMRRLVFPWHKKMVETAHKNGKFAVLHSCGYMVDVMEDVIEDMKYDGRHSYEDNIVPVEEAYARWGGRIAILGGLDMDFLVRRDEKDIYERARHMLELSDEKGGYALGSGNSIPYYVPPAHYFAMTSAVVK